MTREDIDKDIAQAVLQRKRYRDQISCYERRLKAASLAFTTLLDADRNPLHPNSHTFKEIESDPRDDARAYVETLEKIQGLEEFLQRHNAL